MKTGIKNVLNCPAKEASQALKHLLRSVTSQQHIGEMIVNC